MTRPLTLLVSMALIGCGPMSTSPEEAGPKGTAAPLDEAPDTGTPVTHETADTGTPASTDPVDPVDTGDTGTAPLTDLDGDGFEAPDDCDDGDADVNPDARDICDGVDNDCDGAPDPHCHDASTSTSTLQGSGGFDGARLVAADLDGDGDAEAAVGSIFSESVWVFADAPAAGVGSVMDADVWLLGGGFLQCFGCTLGAADLDADGASELLVGAPFTDVGGTDRGVTWVMSDVTSLPPVAGPDLATASIEGEEGYLNLATYSPGTAGDLDGDGAADLLVATTDIVAEASRAYVVPGPFSGPVAAASGVAIDEDDPATELGHGQWIGDVDGDGMLDAVIGDPGRDRVLVYLGPLTADTDTAGADLVLTGSPGDEAGSRIAGGDLDGDGVTDLVIGAAGHRGTDGALFVVHGPVGSGDLATLAGATIVSRDPGARVGHVEYGLEVEDLDGDGLDDLIVGSPGTGPGGTVAAFWGPSLSGTLAVEDGDVEIVGAVGDDAGYGLAVGDTDGDGLLDIWVGIPGWNGNTGGVRVYAGASL